MDRNWISGNQVRQMDYRFLYSVIGKKLTVTMTYGQFEGTLIHVDHGHAIILSKVKDLTTNITKPGIDVFYTREIVNVEVQLGKAACPKMGSEDQPVTKERVKDAPLQKVEEAQDAERKETVSYKDNVRAVEAAVNKLEVKFTVIDQLRTKFGNAIMHIQCQPVVGLGFAGSNVCRHGSLYFLQVATKSHVYLFDVAILGISVFKQGLKAVLEDKSVLKVVHDCRRLSDSLFHQYGVVLNNVFDTQVADIFLFHMTTGGFLPQCTNSLEHCLAEYLNMEPAQISFLSKTQEIMKNTVLWSLHPIPSPLQKALALEASYVLSLHITMANAMMADFTSTVAGYLKVYEHNDVTSWLQIPTTKLPHQFGQLKDSQQNRKEKALKDHVVDENGLLSKRGKNPNISVQDQRARDKKNQMSQDVQCATLDLKRDGCRTGMEPVSEGKSEGHNLELQVASCDNVYKTKVTNQSSPENPVWRAAQNQVYVPQMSRQIQAPFSLHAPSAWSRVRMSASRLLAKTTYTWFP